MKKIWLFFIITSLLILALILSYPLFTQQNDSELIQNTLHYGLTLEASGFDPHIHSSAELGIVLRQVYDTLIYRHPETSVFTPGLAESWRISTDQRTYEFSLRQDVHFHDDTPFNAEAVAANLDRIMSDAAPISQKAKFLLGPLESYEIIDEYVIRFHLSQPFTPLLDGLSQIYLAMASPTALAEYSRNRYQFHQVGTGPFRFIDYLPGDRIILERWADYAWPPAFFSPLAEDVVDQIVFQFYEDPPTRHIALLNGSAHVMGELPPVNAAGLSDHPTIRLYPTNIPGQPLQFLINTQLAPTNELAVRKALLHATDRQAIAQFVYQGFPPVARGPLARQTLFYDAHAGAEYDFNPEKAREILAEAGYRDENNDGVLERGGQALQLNLVIPNWNHLPEAAQLLQEQWRAIQIRLILQPVPGYSALLNRIENNDYHLAPFNSFGPDPALLYDYYHSAGNRNWSRVNDPELDDWLSRAGETSAPDQRRQWYANAQQAIMREALVLPLVEFVNLNAASQRVRGLQFDPYGWFPLLYPVRLLPANT
ncbi:MAG: ABC transporter substrate-binding protein [Chloroflexi bacterium]|nr:ABC transporter substrate-binding protein [Chloroflexota bacterium]